MLSDMKSPGGSARAVGQKIARDLTPGTSRLGCLTVATGSYLSAWLIWAHRLTLVELPPPQEAAHAAECLEGPGTSPSSEQDTGPGRPICGPTMALGIRARHWAGQDGLLGSPLLTCAGA